MLLMLIIFLLVDTVVPLSTHDMGSHATSLSRSWGEEGGRRMVRFLPSKNSKTFSRKNFFITLPLLAISGVLLNLLMSSLMQSSCVASLTGFVLTLVTFICDRSFSRKISSCRYIFDDFNL